MVLSDFCNSWNALYKNHPASYHQGCVTIEETGAEAKNKTFTVNCTEAVCFPSKQFDGYDMFGALKQRNCDGAFLIATEEGLYDLLYVEMKSRFASIEVFEAKCQIVETRSKMKSLLQMLKTFADISIRRIVGVIETCQLDCDQEDLWLKMQLLPNSKLDFGWKLIKYGTLLSPTHCNPNLNMPSEMQFRLVLSDNANYTVDYSDLSNTL